MKLIKIKDSGSGIIEHILLVTAVALTAVLFVHYDFLWRWDNLLYDAQLSLWQRTVSDDIIIIAIDDESLKELGQWPWPRSTHARLINQLELESPRVIGLDIIFNEPDADSPLSDELLARAMNASGKVVLPVFMTQESANSYPIEALPLPEFTRNAAALGHVHIDISDDGIARKVYLKEGIGEPHWLHYSLAMLSITDQAVEPMHSSDYSAHANQYSPMVWAREFPFLIPYAGPPGHVQQIGYAQVLSGQYPQNLFRDKIVLIGTTAEGLADVLPTPLSAHGGAMPGVEIVANIIDAIINDLRIHELQAPWLLLTTAILVALPLLLYPYLNPASTLLVLFSIVFATLIMVALLLWQFGLWVPVSTILLFQFLSYPLWSWRRLVLAMRHINAELNQLSARQKALSMFRDRNIVDELKFIALFIPIKGWVLQDEQGAKLIEEGAAPVCNLSVLEPVGWNVDDGSYWAQVSYQNATCRLGLSIDTKAAISDDEIRLLNSLITTPLSSEPDHVAYLEDVIKAKIKQVQAVGSEYEALRRIIDDSLSGMADGVLICNSRGQIMLSNHRAAWYLYGDDNADVNGRSLIDVLAHIRLIDGDNWKSLLQPVLFKQERLLTQAQHEAGRDLMVEASPLRIIGEVFDGFVVNLSDISMLKASERKRSEVLNFLSHDLRSPLSSMLAMIELAKHKTNIDDMRTMLEDMDSNTNKTLHLAEQFLQLSRANTDENLHFYDIDFNSVVLNAIDQIWALSTTMKVSIEHTFDRDELWTHAEPDLLERAIVNLLSNAIKHSTHGSVVSVSVYQHNGDIVCCVVDRGSGISPKELPHLFEMFRRTQGHGVERKQGIGLGLAFVDAVAKRHNGRVDVDSCIGEGSSFCLKFPHVEPLEPIEPIQ
ncbi:MAG: CHASE2 domain-containing protein [Gammaproteobacteria bacterium]|nr:CHASE2 domain-containing protein [Gammaproteobacteria bacterium]